MSPSTQVIFLCAFLSIEIVSSNHIKKKFQIEIEHMKEIVPEKKEEVKKEEVKKEEEKPKELEIVAVAIEVPEQPAPVIEILADDLDVNAGLPFLKPIFEPTKVPIEREVIEVSNGRNTNIVNSLITVQNDVNSKSVQRELPRRQSPQPIDSLNEILITPRPVPAEPRPTPSIVPPERKQLAEGVSPVPPVAPKVSPVPWPYVPRYTILAPTVPVVPVRAVSVPPVAPPPPPPPAAPASPPPPPPAPVTPPPETPLMKPRRYVAYLGDMFLKLMTQLLGRARLTFNRISGPPPTSPELEKARK